MRNNQDIHHGRICCFEECPSFLQSNENIKAGYRVHLSTMQCLKSIFMLTNETVNIWSHLLGSIMFLFNIAHVNLFILPGCKNSNVWDHIIMTSFCVCVLFCLLFSAGFHVFCCQSQEAYNKWLRLDLIGITLSLWGCYIPSIYYGFYCYKLWEKFYTGSIVMMMTLNMVFHWYARKSDSRSIVFFCLLVLFGIIPVIHWTYLLGGLGHPLAQLFIPRVVVMYMICAAAFIFYISKIPERFFPGWFDYVGASHQTWHVLILAAFVWWYQSSLELLNVRLIGVDSCSSPI